MFLCLFVLKQPLVRSLLLCSPSLSTSDFCFSSALFSQRRDPSAKSMTKMGMRKTITTTIKILSRQTKTMNHELVRSSIRQWSIHSRNGVILTASICWNQLTVVLQTKGSRCFETSPLFWSPWQLLALATALASCLYFDFPPLLPLVFCCCWTKRIPSFSFSRYNL